MTRYSFLKNLFGVIVLVALASCKESEIADETPLPTTRAVFVYMGAENSLSRWAANDLEEMIEGASLIPRDAKLLVYVDDLRDNPRIYEISRMRKDTVRLYTYPNSKCSADPAEMREVFSRMKTLAPAPEYGVVIWSHGCGWLPGVHRHNNGPQKSVIYDGHGSTADSRTCKMGIEEFAEAMTVLPKLKFLFFDACLMQTIETDYALRDVADYIIASPAEIPGKGATYQRMFQHFFQKSFDPKAIAQQYYDDEKYAESHTGVGGVVISVVDTRQLEQFAQVTKKLVGGAELRVNDAQLYWLFCGKTVDYPDYYDMKGVMRQFAESEYYAEWCAQRDKTIIAFYATPTWDSVCDAFSRGWITDMDDVCGVGIHIPQAKYGSAGRTWDDDIKQTEWWKAVM